MRLHRGGIDRFGKEASEDRIGRRGIGLDGDDATRLRWATGVGWSVSPSQKRPCPQGSAILYLIAIAVAVTSVRGNLTRGIQIGMQMNFR